MNAPISVPTPAEIERQRLVAELEAERGANWANAWRPGTHGCHELLDRAALLADLLESQLVNHPACIARAEWFALAVQAAIAIRELYQRVGTDHLDENG